MKLQLNIDNFLTEYWQKKPLLIRNAIPGFIPPLNANELAGLAMEEDVESRIIETQADGWGLSHGPFHESDYTRPAPWTLLVQAVDHYIPKAAELLDLLDFIPNWRIDDVMVSYATDGGSVGPHYDNYDVFLLQGEGQRRWNLGQLCDHNSALLPHPDLRILDEFQCNTSYTLGPGDMLYIPPGVAHWGLAEGECTTWSLGLRAPRINALLSRWIDEMLEHVNPEKFYCDPSLSAATLLGEIRPEDIERAKTQLLQALGQKIPDHWFGELVTEPRYDLQLSEGGIQNERELISNSAVTAATLLASAKLAWQKTEAGIDLFANGECMPLSRGLSPAVIALCKDGMLTGPPLIELQQCAEGQEMLVQLLCLACISIE